jgi:hypothetical protein
MSDPSIAVQTAVFEALTGASVCEGRVYDRVPKGADKPYCTIGDDVVVDDSNTCWTQDEITCQVHVWSEAVGSVEAKEEVSKIRSALTGTLILEEPYKVALGEFRSLQSPPSGDALTTPRS